MQNPVWTWRRTQWAAALLAVLLVLSLAPYLTSSTELVRVRNALLYEPVSANADWTPAAPPAGFLLERISPPEAFRRIVDENRLFVDGNDWETALRIGRHLVHRADDSGRSGPIQADLLQSYRRITDTGDGYCGDYVDVFTALATTAGVFARSWAFSFDGYGGHGHVFNEIWDRQAGRWRMIDVFNNYFVIDGAGEPLSALQFRQALLDGGAVRWQPVDASARPGFKYAEKALDYYRRGAAEWYLWWGNNVFEFEGSRLVEVASAAGRPAEQLAAIVAGVHPGIRAIHEPRNEESRTRLLWVRYHLLLVAVGSMALAVFLLAGAARSRRAGRTPGAKGVVR